jgi:choline dehydrogenase-like flavoprotein
MSCRHFGMCPWMDHGSKIEQKKNIVTFPRAKNIRGGQARNGGAEEAHLEALLRRDTGDIQHAAGSCRMTGFNDADGVVNPDGTVKGIVGLRVADASIMPSDCRANTHFTTVVIGEAMARMMMRKL